jgi:hypothetical protein
MTFLTKSVAGAVATAACCVSLPSGAELSPEVADLAGRIDYGYYVADPRAIEDALPGLERMSDDDLSIRYYRAFAAFRLAQLQMQDGTNAAPLAVQCVELATVKESKDWVPRAEAEARAKASVESWILSAACSGLAARRTPGEGLALDKRGEEALERARARDSANPRVALLDAWRLSMRPALAEPEVRAETNAKLESAIEAFAAWSPSADSPTWGEAEALAALAEVRLAEGEVRAGRDLIERALLLAPDYHFAVELRSQLRAARAEAR